MRCPDLVICLAVNRDQIIRELCAATFASPSRLVDALTHQVQRPFTIEPHAHDDLLQFDLILGCRGEAVIDNRSQNIHGITALVSYPNTVHGYTLLPGDPPSHVYHFKLRPPDARSLCSNPPFPSILTGLTHAERLTTTLRLIMQLAVVQQARPPFLLTRVAEALCLWPTESDSNTRHPSSEDHPPTLRGIDPGMAAAIKLARSRLNEPPSLTELAEVACLSPRHFARQFRQLFGCTPHHYVTAQRFAAARDLLLQDQMRIHQVAEMLGFSSAASFSRWFTQRAGVSPRHFRADPAVM